MAKYTLHQWRALMRHFYLSLPSLCEQLQQQPTGSSLRETGIKCIRKSTIKHDKHQPEVAETVISMPSINDQRKTRARTKRELTNDTASAPLTKEAPKRDAAEVAQCGRENYGTMRSARDQKRDGCAPKQVGKKAKGNGRRAANAPPLRKRSLNDVAAGLLSSMISRTKLREHSSTNGEK